MRPINLNDIIPTHASLSDHKPISNYDTLRDNTTKQSSFVDFFVHGLEGSHGNLMYESEYITQSIDESSNIIRTLSIDAKNCTHYTNPSALKDKSLYVLHHRR